MRMRLLVNHLYPQIKLELDHEHPLQHHLQSLEDRAVVYVTIRLLKLKNLFELQLSLKYHDNEMRYIDEVMSFLEICKKNIFLV